ncbi:MAG: PepSY domain-containing protein [Methylobacteriaceae bacterium]|nr:PepSY domain-containing protein [Methylobacteriaceae bacterium]
MALADPFALLRAQAAEQRAEAIAVKLCRQGDVYVYEIDLLRRDGRLIHSRVDARSGRLTAQQGPQVEQGGRACGCWSSRTIRI